MADNCGKNMEKTFNVVKKFVKNHSTDCKKKKKNILIKVGVYK